MNLRLFFSLLFSFALWTSNLAAFVPLATPDRFEIRYPDDEEPTEELAQLGRLLFFDNRLSFNQTQSCATCHNPDLGFSDGLKTGLGAKGERLGRNTPHLYNLAWEMRFFWDGRAESLEKQALGPIASSAEMNMDLAELLPRLKAVPAYQKAFKKQFPDQGVTPETLAQALAAFERTLIVDDTPFDRYLKGDLKALSPAAKRGLALFKDKARCVQCHDGPNFTDHGFHNIGLPDKDLGRYGIEKRDNLYKAFKTPGLRNVAFSAPYMHDGSLASLEEVVRFYNKGGEKVKAKDKAIKPLELSEQEIFDLIAFLGALSQPLVIERPEVP
ncbi:MAG: cytochrome c peroxidase [bacterium]|nr:cytochrome c peroxidase [bacterium]